MPLLNSQNNVPASATATTGGNVAKTNAPIPKLDKEATKKANEKKLKEKRRQQKVDICAYLRSVGNLPANIETIVHDWENPRVGGAGGAFGEPFFNKVFGATPKVGDKVTLQDVFNRTFKGVDKMNEFMKKWKEKNTAVVEYIHNPTTPLLSEYVIKTIG